MPFSEEPKKKCYCTRVRYRNMPPDRWNYVCEQHRSEWDTIFLEIFPNGMRDTVDFTLKFEIGFEKFGSYEGWGQGWIAEGIVKDKRIYVSHRYMRDAVENWLKAAKAHLTSVEKE